MMMADATQVQVVPLWMDGFGGQEDELEDVHKGILTPPTDDEGPGSVDDANGQGMSKPVETDQDDLDSLERRAGLKPL